MKLKQRPVSEILAENQEPTIDGIIVIDCHGIILVFDSAAQDLFGYSSEEVLGQPLEILMHAFSAKTHPTYLNKAAKRTNNEARKLHMERDIIGRHKFGHSIPLAITVSADNSTGNVRFTGVIQDLRKHEDQLTRLFQDFQATTNALNQRIEFESLLNTHGNTLLSCSPSDFYTAMEDALQSISKYLSLDHAFILKLSDDLSQAFLWAEWRRSVGLMKPFPDRFNIPDSQKFSQVLLENDIIVIAQGENKGNEILFQLAQQLSPNGFHSSHISPILNDKGLLAGVIGFSIIDPNQKPTDVQISLLSLARQLIINAWGRHQLILQRHEAEAKIQAKNKLLANKAAYSQTLLRGSNTLFLSTRDNIKRNIQEVLIQAALISGHQQALIYYEKNSSKHLNSFIQQHLYIDPNQQQDCPNLIKWINKELNQKPILQVDDTNKSSLSNKLSVELKTHKIQGLTAIKLNRAELNIGFIIFYNSLPILNNNDESLRFLELTGQNLSAAIQHHSIQFDLEISEQNLLRANRLLSQQAFNDALTGLANRRAFDHSLSQEFDRAKRHHSKLTLLMCDIDYFKYYNDHYGHPQGDTCLQHVAKLMQRTFNRAGELCTRYGGEEFAIILPSISQQEAEYQAQRLINELEKSKIKQSPSAPFDYISLSVGIAQFSQENDYPDDKTLINAADQALYQAKNNGRNQLAWASKAE